MLEEARGWLPKGCCTQIGELELLLKGSETPSGRFELLLKGSGIETEGLELPPEGSETGFGGLLDFETSKNLPLVSPSPAISQCKHL